MSQYTIRGYENREQYLCALAQEYGVSRRVVALVADTLVPNEDFDALITELEECPPLDDEGEGD